MNESELFIVEPATEDDLNFIRASWLRSFCDSQFARAAAPSYWVEHLKVRDKLLTRCGAVVARVEEVPTSVCGWACFEANAIHYVFVKPRWRRKGIAKKLLEPFDLAPSVVYTHRTKDSERINIPETWVHNPYEAIR